ncbi:tRNA (adenosine(37)-N6)-threonylcarbamoyltransferase complex ATPase subunit type 1 TsaE [Sansalvadorimonas verongulae]|uniref:tRNA (adenosine(37)-N6)-threonylcarbamoyltransferase complex ATPase subunit type 1 TsaE n=1 Tax=Sansalvadorimonas verongulae TaxID=2172824 RepID=UPI0012BC793E|nr:tRNA (adenosine(37)-N6)-threonylcarbamoyltransferase complex ATPase subunit type 1 TsaE [Sansalvadorimonas verongulae]MTI13848.1 tRNA (adenosine(37)-N6)-threonylcarbamoyltransferase complex ATPase subunit type 1 TsaE [Sansalvadorimonas verongulae]
MSFELKGEEAMVDFGRRLAEASQGWGVFYLEGDLGAGKTTLSRGILRGFGHEGAVKSPTYTLVEPYEMVDQSVYHFDLYRLGDPEELDFLGVREYFGPHALCLVEWPIRGKGFLPEADIIIRIAYRSDSRVIEVEPISEHGQTVCNHLSSNSR